MKFSTLTLLTATLVSLAHSALALPAPTGPEPGRIRALYQSTLLANELTATDCKAGTVVFTLPGYPRPLCALPSSRFAAGFYTVQPDTMRLVAPSTATSPGREARAGANR